MQMIPNEANDEERRKKERIRKNVMHVLANEKVRLNDTIGTNRKLKEEINIMRKEIVFAKDSIKKMDN